MPEFAIHNFGCRATQADAAALEGQLRKLGFQAHTERNLGGRADVVIVNTCTVTAAADAQARQAIRAIHQGNPEAQIIVTGCYAQRAPEELAELAGVRWVVGNSNQTELPALIQNMEQPVQPDFVPLAAVAWPAAAPRQSDCISAGKILVGEISREFGADALLPEAPLGDHTRPILKIQDGCDNRCAYCIIPMVRGRSRSLAPERIVEQCQIFCQAGCKEVVVSGINLGSYGRDLAPRATLRQVLQRILEETEVEQLRLSSIEPMDITQDLVEFVAGNPRLAPHFHVPLQSGSDRILRLMHRWYRAEQYARRVALIREILPDAAIGADVIAGFPSETESDYRATLNFIAALPFTYLHVFSFSPRPGTKAENARGQAPAAVIRSRARELRAMAARKQKEFRNSQTGRMQRVLTLNRRGEVWTEALTGNYLKLRIGGHWLANQRLDAIVPPENEMAEGRPTAPEPISIPRQGVKHAGSSPVAHV